MASEKDPFDPNQMASLKHWGERPGGAEIEAMDDEVVLDCGWGRLLFGQTFQASDRLAAALRGEADGRRDIALYIRDPHVVLSFAPQDLFLDPSLTYRLTPENYKSGGKALPGVRVREARLPDEVDTINRIYLARGMVPCHGAFAANRGQDDPVSVLVAEAVGEGAAEPMGAVTGVDHRLAFGDPDGGSSLWALAVDPQAPLPGIGELLVRTLAERFFASSHTFMDLSVKHDNHQAIALYEKLGFEQVPVYCLKNKNSINEPLFIGPAPEEGLNVYARIIVDEARRRGISVEVVDAEAGYFTLTLGGRAITCRESLSELTTAIAMSRCDDKAVTRRILRKAGLGVPEQIVAGDDDDGTNAARAFLERHGRIVVKPARGEQGHGVRVDLGTLDEVDEALAEARTISDRVVVEEFVTGEDLRVIVIDDQVVAAAVRRPARVQGDGKTTIRDLIAKQSRRRAAATQGESRIPLDAETRRAVNAAGYEMDDLLPEGVSLTVRKTANLHTGGTIHDVTGLVHPKINDAAVRAARAIGIPVVGLDFIVPDVSGPDYVVIEANERPGLANHEPQPTVERFVDLLFPQTRAHGV